MSFFSTPCATRRTDREVATVFAGSVPHCFARLSTASSSPSALLRWLLDLSVPAARAPAFRNADRVNSMDVALLRTPRIRALVLRNPKEPIRQEIGQRQDFRLDTADRSAIGQILSSRRARGRMR